MFDIKIVSNKLLKIYPELKNHLHVRLDSILFSIVPEYVNYDETILLEVDFSDYTSICLSGPILNKGIQFPCFQWVKPQEKTFKRNLEDNPTDYEWCYNLINKYIPKIKEGIEWYNSVNCDYAAATLKNLGFENFLNRWTLAADDIEVEVTLPLADYPCFHSSVSNDKGYFEGGWRYCATFDELLNKLTEEK